MRRGLLLGATAAAGVNAASFSDICRASYVQAALPADGTTAGITLDPTSATANTVYNASVSGEDFFPDATFDYCIVTVAYSHNGRDDQVPL
jgi:tannase